MIKCIRGAITVERNTREDILDATKVMLLDIIKNNNLDLAQIISIYFTATKDLDAAYPAVAAREIGICDAALMCVQEMYVQGSLKMCIRANVTAMLSDEHIIRHSYLRGAARLRPDLAAKVEAVAIDGPAGSGKSTVAKTIAKELGYIYVDTGAMYRAVGLYCVNNGIDTKAHEAVAKCLDDINIEIEHSNGEQTIILNGENVTSAIRTQAAAQAASDVAVIQEVRERLVALQQSLAGKGRVVMDGRDVGTNVIPNARVKIYLDASVEARTKRRCNELKEKGLSYNEAEIKEKISERDEQDKNRELNPLRKADDAHYIDSSDLNVDEVKAEILSIINGR